MFRAIISHFSGRLLKYCFENIFNLTRDTLLFPVLLWRGVSVPLLSCAGFYSFARLRWESKAAVGKAEGCSGRGSPSSCCSAVCSAVPEPWRARLGSVGQDKTYVWAGDGMVPASAAVAASLLSHPRSRNSKSDFSCVSHKLEQSRLDPWAAKFNFACTTGDFYQGWCGSCCLPWCWCELEKEVLYKCCLMATSCVAQPHSKGTLLECVQNYNHLSSLSP